MKEKLYCVVCEKELTGNQRKYCCNNCKQKAHYDDKKSNTNSYHSQTKRSIRRKLELVELSGGGCCKCGYNKNIAALEFHHKDPSTKEFQLDARHLSNRSMDAIMQEFVKCQLLCSNCHSEEHYPESNYKTLLENIDKYS